MICYRYFLLTALVSSSFIFGMDGDAGPLVTGDQGPCIAGDTSTVTVLEREVDISKAEIDTDALRTELLEAGKNLQTYDEVDALIKEIREKFGVLGDEDKVDKKADTVIVTAEVLFRAKVFKNRFLGNADLTTDDTDVVVGSILIGCKLGAALLTHLDNASKTVPKS